jgi:hypothetical protein
MDQKQTFKQMIDFQKATFDNSIKAMTMVQEQGERLFEAYLEQSPWLPEEGRRVVRGWIEAYRKGRSDFIDAVERNFERVQNYFEEETEKTQGSND